MKVAVLCVNYNSFKEFQIYYKSIKKAEKNSNVKVTVILFDNSSLIKKKQLAAYKHEKFWYCMDNLRDKNVLEKLIKQKKAPWLKSRWIK